MYKFPLGAVLRHRKYLEENLQKELGVLKKQLFDDKKKLSDLKKARKKYAEELHSKQQKVISVSDSILYIRKVKALTRLFPCFVLFCIRRKARPSCDDGYFLAGSTLGFFVPGDQAVYIEKSVPMG